MAMLTLLPSGKKIKLTSHQTIAAALRGAGFKFGEDCAHDAHCLACWIDIIDGQDQIDYGEFQSELAPLLAQEHKVLACLATIKGNVILEADLALQPRKTAVVRRSVTHDVAEQGLPNMEMADAASAPSGPRWYRFWEKESSGRRTRGGGRRARFFTFDPSAEGPKTSSKFKKGPSKNIAAPQRRIFKDKGRQNFPQA